MSICRAANRVGVSFGPLVRLPSTCHQWKGLPLARPFSTTNVARVTDASRQRTVGAKPPPRKRSDQGADDLYVPVMTREQKEAADAKKKAEEAFVEATKAASEADTVARILKKVADDATEAKQKADEAVQAAKKVADDAWVAKRKADERAVEVMQTAAKKEKAFLQNAFQHWDTQKVGKLTQDQIRLVLEELKLPAEIGDVDELMQVLDIAKDHVIHLSEWKKHMPQEYVQALRNHPLAAQWE